jgi:hypothetical protein
MNNKNFLSTLIQPPSRTSSRNARSVLVEQSNFTNYISGLIKEAARVPNEIAECFSSQK